MRLSISAISTSRSGGNTRNSVQASESHLSLGGGYKSQCMDEAERHYPPGAEPEQETPAAEQTPEDKPADAPAPEAKPEEGKPEEQPEGEKPSEEQTLEGEKPADEETPADNLPKKRSIYDDLKEERTDRKGYQQIAVQALKAQGIELTGKESVEELSALLQKKSEAETPAENADADDDLKAFAEAEGMTVEAVEKLFGLFEKRVTSKSALPDDAKAQLSEFQAWKQEQEATDRRKAEDAAIAAEAPTVKKFLDIHDDGELATVMAEITRLSHTKEFHDKEVEYIAWKKKDVLAKLVSPKKPSFESAGKRGDQSEAAATDFTSGKVKPGQVQDALRQGRTSYEVTSPSR